MKYPISGFVQFLCRLYSNCGLLIVTCFCSTWVCKKEEPVYFEKSKYNPHLFIFLHLKKMMVSLFSNFPGSTNFVHIWSKLKHDVVPMRKTSLKELCGRWKVTCKPFCVHFRGLLVIIRNNWPEHVSHSLSEATNPAKKKRGTKRNIELK